MTSSRSRARSSRANVKIQGVQSGIGCGWRIGEDTEDSNAAADEFELDTRGGQAAATAGGAFKKRRSIVRRASEGSSGSAISLATVHSPKNLRLA
jgi:hypothetical protein